MKLILRFWFLSLFFISSVSHAFYGLEFGFDPALKWKTITTPHFRVTYPEELQEFATHSAALAEEAHALLAPRLYWEPKTRTQITIVDSIDSANGLTSAALRFGIVLFATPPESWFSTNYVEDWLRLLIIHEYTHLLNMDVTEDWSEVLRWIFGDVIRPNALWYPWMLEGLAVYMETKLSQIGRGRSPYYEGILRTAVSEGKLRDPHWYSFHKLGGTNPYPPGGESTYFFGYQLMNQVRLEQEKKKNLVTSDGRHSFTEVDDVLGIMSRRSGSRIPFFISGNLKAMVGKSWDEVWDEFLATTETKKNLELSLLRKKPITTPIDWISNGRSPPVTALSFDGKTLAYTFETADDLEQKIFLIDLNDPSHRSVEVREKFFGSGFAFTPNSTHLLISELRRKDNYRLFSDLVLVDLKTGKRRFLTKGARAKDPDVSSDGKVVFTKTEGPKQSLVVAKLSEKTGEPTLDAHQVIYEGKIYDRILNPKISRDGTRVAFSLHQNGEKGIELMEYSLKTHETKTLVRDGHQNRFPTFDENGALYFVSDKTGVENLYQWRTQKEAELKTNLEGGIWFPTIGKTNSKKIFGATLHAGEWRLSEIPSLSSPVSPREVTLPEVNAPSAPPKNLKEAKKIGEESTQDETAYSVFPTILPRYWAPFILLDEKGAEIGGQVGGFDALDLHEYSLFGTYDTELKLGNGSLSYTYRGLGPYLSVFGANYTSAKYFRSTGEVSLYERKVLGAAAVSYPIIWAKSELLGSVSTQFESEKLYSTRLGKDQPIAKTRFLPSVSGQLAFSDEEASPLSLTSEKGRIARLGERHYFDSPHNTLKHFISWTESLRLFQHIVLTPSFTGSLVHHTSPYEDANVLVRGRAYRLIKTSLGPGDSSLDEVLVRGYRHLGTLRTKWASLGSFDLSVPLFRFFRGFSTYPLFLENLYLISFGEVTRAEKVIGGPVTLPSFGGGARLSLTVFSQASVLLSLEFHRGLRTQEGGGNEWIASLLAPAIPF